MEQTSISAATADKRLEDRLETREIERPTRGKAFRSRWSKVLLTHAVLIVLSILFLLPFLWMVSTSLKTQEATMVTPAHPFTLVPLQTDKLGHSHVAFQWSNFKDAFEYNADTLGYVPFLVYARNTIILCWLTVIGVVFSCSLVAYSFARLRWKGRDAFFWVTLATMMIPFPVLMVPTYGLFRYLGWIGTFRPLWVPAFFGSAFSIFLLRQFFATIPFELSEAAKIDGASEFRTFLDVVLPLAKPALAVVALFTFIGTWNDFLGPLIYLMDQKTFTLSLGLQAYQSQNGGTAWNLLMAATLIVILPVVILFFLTQRLLIRGIALTGLKG